MRPEVRSGPLVMMMEMVQVKAIGVTSGLMKGRMIAARRRRNIDMEYGSKI